MSNSSRLYGCLFLLVIVISIGAGYIVATSLPSSGLRLSNPIAGLLGSTATSAHVDVRLVTPSPAQPGAATTEAQPTQSGDAQVVTPTLRPAPTVVAPTFDLGAVTATPGGAATTAVVGTATITTTPTITATPTRSAYLFLSSGQPVMHPEKGCALGAVFGYVYDERGQALQGVQVRVYDPWNHVFTAVTKAAPDAGYYDVIQGSGPVTWYVVVVDALGNQVSPVVTVEHKEGASGCWYQVDFRRTRAQ
ncbi:MAG: hypothetical protein ACYC5O_19965 [Anaerolineae bacterium]